MVGPYKVITLCGSTRFKEQFLEAQKRLTLEGNIVISVGLFGHSGDEEVWTEGTKEMLDDMHKRKIDMADEIFVINVGGYIGSSTRSEIEYAKANEKTVRYMEEGNDAAYLVRGYEVSEEDLTTLLQEPAYNKYNAIAKNGLAAALKEYYAATTNAEKVLILKSILDNMPFVELKRLSRSGCRLFAMCQSENDLPSSNEFPGNLSLARKLMANGYNVYMLGNPNGIRSADFIATKKNMVYYLEGKTMNGRESLDELLSKASSQSERVVIDIIGTDDIHYIVREIKNAFVHNLSLLEVILLNGSRLISVDRRRWGRKDFEKDLQKEWMGHKK